MQEGDIDLAKACGSLGKMTLVRRELGGAVIRCTDKVLTEYLLLYLESLWRLERLDWLMVGAT